MGVQFVCSTPSPTVSHCGCSIPLFKNTLKAVLELMCKNFMCMSRTHLQKFNLQNVAVHLSVKNEPLKNIPVLYYAAAHCS